MTLENISKLSTAQAPQRNGISFPAVEGMGGFFTRTQGITTILSGLKQLLLTSKGERVMNPDFGTSLRRSVFEPFTPELKETLTQEVTRGIAIYHPEVLINSLEISWNESKRASGTNQIYLSLLFRVSQDLSNEHTLEVVV
jgi:phage baseplate assembly protein W